MEQNGNGAGKRPLRVAVTGGSGQIAYSLLFRLAAGALSSCSGGRSLELRVGDLPAAVGALQGVAMELEDCAFPGLSKVWIGSDLDELFEAADLVVLLGSKPRGPGMERSDLLKENGKIFLEQGQALNRAATAATRVLVVGNPCNTNCLIAMEAAPKIARSHFHAMTRLDENRARAALAGELSLPVAEVSRMTIWGNHSASQVPDFTQVVASGVPIASTALSRGWLEGPFCKRVQERGAAIIQARGKSSAASAASAVIDALRSLLAPTPHGEWFSSAICSDGNPYGIAEGLIFSFPCRVDERGECRWVEGLPWDHFIREKIAVTAAELAEERRVVQEMQLIGSGNGR